MNNSKNDLVEARSSEDELAVPQKRDDEEFERWIEEKSRINAELQLVACSWSLDAAVKPTKRVHKGPYDMTKGIQVFGVVQRASDLRRRYVLTEPAPLRTIGDVVKAFDDAYRRCFLDDCRPFFIEEVKEIGHGLYEVICGT